MGNLALVLHDQGKYDDAEKMNRRALEGYEKVLEQDHPDTLMSVNNLALVLQDQGKYDEAEEMNQRALKGREKELGLNRPNTLSSIYCLAYLLNARDEHHGALALYHQASSGFAKILGPKHPTTLACQKHKEILLKSLRAESLVWRQPPVRLVRQCGRARNRILQHSIGSRRQYFIQLSRFILERSAAVRCDRF